MHLYGKTVAALGVLATLAITACTSLSTDPSTNAPPPVLTPVPARPTPPTLDQLLAQASVLTPQLAALSGREGFIAYRNWLVNAAGRGRNAPLAQQLNGLSPGRAIRPEDRAVAERVLRAYLQARYGAAMVRDLRAMVRFRTVAPATGDPWNEPELVRQREWLAGKAKQLGLEFESFGGRVEQITLPATASGAVPIVAVLTHGDVQDVVGQAWSSPPWEAELVGERIIGRGTEDDKGPIVAALYGLAAMADTGWTRPATLRLLVANAEESTWEDLPYYLERAPRPHITVGLDAAYPVTHAQKGYGVVTIRAPRAASEQPVAVTTPEGVAAGPPKWRLLNAGGGSGLSIIAEQGEAFLVPPGPLGANLEAAKEDLSARAAAWAEAHPPARLTVSADWPALRVVAHGRGGHSSAPASGHNALGDLTAFLDSLDLEPDAWGTLVTFLGRFVGQETDGAALGVRHRDEGMGPLTVNLSFVETAADGLPQARLNLRVPRGLPEEEIQRRLSALALGFGQQTGGALEVQAALLSQPHWVPPEGPLVGTLLEVWRDVTGTEGQPVAIGGGTQARLFPGGVDFGPALDMATYRGHGTDEFLTVGELHRIAELTLSALWRLGLLPAAAEAPASP